MTRLRFRGGDQSKGGSILLLALGAIAGVALGMALAERSGGVSGLRARVQRRLGRGPASTDHDVLESMRMADGAADDYEDFDDGYEHEFEEEFEDEFDAELEDEDEPAGARNTSGRDLAAGALGTDRGPVGASRTHVPSEPLPRPAPSEPELEARVLDVFQNDPTLRGQAIDIGAIGPGIIELTGWVPSAAEMQYATVLAGGVLDVVEVMNSLVVRDAERSRVGAARADR